MYVPAFQRKKTVNDGHGVIVLLHIKVYEVSMRFVMQLLY